MSTGGRWLLMAAMLLASSASGQAAPARLQPPDAQTSRSDDAYNLFVEARALLDQNRLAEACERFEQSERLVSTIATLLNLGLCARGMDEPLRALDYYRRAEVTALAAHDAERAQGAGAEAASLEAQLARLTWLVIDRSRPDLEVWLDDAAQPKERWGAPAFVRPGKHVVRATRAGDELWSERVTLAAGEQRILTVPQWVDATGPAQLVSESQPLAAQRMAFEDADDAGLGTQRWLAISLGALGVAGVGVAATFGVIAWNESADAAPHCNATCGPEGVALRERALTQATRADVALLTGVLALGGAAALWFTAPSPSARSPRVGLKYQSGGVNLRLALDL